MRAKQTSSNAFLTSFISLLGTDLMIFPAKHKYFIWADVWLCHFLSASVCIINVVPLKSPRSAWANTSASAYDESPTLARNLSLRSLSRALRHAYLGSRRAASCPRTGTPRCEGRGSRPGVGCCSAPGAAGVSAMGNKTWETRSAVLAVLPLFYCTRFHIPIYPRPGLRWSRLTISRPST